MSNVRHLKDSMHIPHWLRYIGVALAAALFASFVTYRFMNQTFAVLMASHLATMGKGVAATQRFMSEGKTNEANKLLCTLSALTKESIGDLDKVIDEGLFPKYAMDAALPADRRNVKASLEKLQEAEARCKTSGDRQVLSVETGMKDQRPPQMPNPSIERDVQGLSPLAAPHVKR